MILTSSDIKRILKDRPNKAVIEAAKKYNNKMLMHIKGIGLADYIERMEGFERKEILDIRKKYARSNRDLFARLHRPEDKVFSARGGSTYYATSPQNEKRLRDLLSDVEWGHSMRQWIEAFWKAAYHYDPMGLVYMEVGNGETYPTYKSIADVYDYQHEGRMLEYVVFETDKKIDRVKDGQKIQNKVYRIVDDATDMLVEWDGENYRTLKNETYPNYFGRVPAHIISDRYDQVTGLYISPDDEVVELADAYLMEGSVLNVFKKYFGFPRFWQYIGVCQDCKGTRHKGGDECPTCNGSGAKTSHDVSETINLPIPAGEDPVLAPNVAGSITPDIEGWREMKIDKVDLEDAMFITRWGTLIAQRAKGPDGTQEGTKGATATEMIIDQQPLIEQLNKLSESAEAMETWITNMIGQFNFNTAWNGAMVNYGRIYIISTPDEALKQYQEAKAKGASITLLNDKYTEYLYTKYPSWDPNLAIALKFLYVEPAFHMDMTAAKNVLPVNEYVKKVYYSDWYSTLTPAEKLNKKITDLRNLLTEYANTAGKDMLDQAEEERQQQNNRIAA